MKLFAAVLAGSLPVFAFSPYYSGGRVARWDVNFSGYDPNVFNASTKTIRYFIGSDTWSTVNRTAELNAIRASFAQWQAISGTTLKFEEAGLATTNIDIWLGDGRNLVFWAKSNRVNDGMDDITNLVGYTLIALDAENRILESDIALNGVNSSWITDFSNTVSAANFVESIALHEIGHFLGLDHSPLGGATVLDGSPGVGPSAGLSTDEISAARFLYPAAGTLAQLGGVSGTVRLNGAGVSGAMVAIETSAGIAISATPTDAAGNYQLPALAPGNYLVHASPLDPNTAAANMSLFRGKDVAFDFPNPNTGFKATENTPVTLAAGAVTTVNFSVASSADPLRVQQLSKPTTVAGAPSQVRYAVGGKPGTQFYVGVLSAAFTADTQLQITGPGISLGNTVFELNRFGNGLNLIQTLVTIAPDAVPGLRTFVVRKGGDVAYANGYFEVFSPTPDYNFDGLDDRFQRQYFPLFTAPEAGPGADPDNDRFSNAFEQLTATDPKNAQSFLFQIERVDLLQGQARITFKSDVGKQYQLYGKEDAAGAVWQTVGPAVTAIANSTVITDDTARALKFYKLRLLP